MKADQIRRRAAENEDGRRGQIERPAGTAGTEDQQGPEGTHTRHPETLLVLDVGADGGHEEGYGPEPVRDWPEMG